MNARVKSRLKGQMVRIVLGVLGLLAGVSLAHAGQQQPQGAGGGRFLGREEIRLHGLNLLVTPAEQVVPKDIATIVSALLQEPEVPTGQGAAAPVSPFAPDAELRATLRGPSLAAPLELVVKPGHPFDIPALKVPGIHMLENIRLVSNGEVLLRGNPESAKIEVIEKLLVSQVTARALTADEIREKRIVFDQSNFQAYNFSAAFAVADTPITINFPVLLPRLDGAKTPTNPVGTIPGVPTPSIPQLSTIIPDTLKLQTKLPNLQVVGFSLKIPDVKNGNLIVPPIPGIIAIPGDIGFLNQFFSVLLMVGNVAPAGSNLVVSNLTAEIVLPAGKDNVPKTPDDPLRMAMTARGEILPLQVVAQPGADGKLGTGDDIATIGPGQSGNAEYLVEGRREGSHIVEMRIKGTLNGLPVGPVEVTGTAMGAVLVRNPTFQLTFTHPEVVTAGEAYQLDVTVTNSSSSPANFVSLNLNGRDIGGATLLGESTRSIDSIAPGDSATVSFDLEAKVTGKVFAATLDADEGVSGRFALKTSVGELGVPLSPDSLVLPAEAKSLPKPLRDAAIGLLGKAWAVATAPPAAVPADLLRFSRKIVLDRAVEVAEAGLRESLGEPLKDSAAQLALDFLGSNFPRLPQRNPDADTLAFEQNNFRGFDLLRRRSIRGDVFADAVASLLAEDLTGVGPTAFHRGLAEKISYRPGVISVLASAPGPLPVRLAIADATGRRTGGTEPTGAVSNGKITKEIPFSDLLPFKDSGGTLTAELALVGAPDPGTFTVRLTRAAGMADGTPFTLSLVIPGANDTLRHVVFDGLVAGQRPVVAYASGVPYRLVIEWVNGPVSGEIQPTTDTPITDPAPSIISVIQRDSADQIVCDAKDLRGPRPGRIVAVLFSEEVTPASVQDRLKVEAITNYAIDNNAVVGVALQPGRRIAYLGLRDPFGPLVQRSITISHVSDTRGNIIAPSTHVMTPTVQDHAGVVSGQVLRADGTPAAFANVRLFYRSPCSDEEISWTGISSKTTDASGRFSWDFVLTGLPARIVAVDADSNEVRDIRFQVRTHAQRLNVNLVFLGRGTLTGRTLGPDGRTPLPDTHVRVTSATDQSQYGARSDAAGRFTIANVPVGSLVIDAVNTDAVARTTVSELIPFAGATTTVDLVLEDASSEPITIKRGTITGFVLESNGRTPAIGVPVVAYYQSNSQPSIPCPRAAVECPVAMMNTDALGAFKFEQVPAGSLRLQTFNQSSFEQGQVGVVLAENQTLSANIILAGGLGTVRVLVIDPDGRPVQGASVGGGLSLGTTGADGRVTLNDVPIGHREIVAASNAVGSRASAWIDLLYAGQTVDATIVLDAVGSVSGVVTRHNNQPAIGVQVYVFQKEGQNVQVVGTATTNDQGGYRIDRVPVKDYSVSAFTSDFTDGNIVPALVKFHGQVVRADIKFRGGNGRVTGRVLADDGKTPLRARVAVSGEQVIVAGGVLGVEFRRVENFRIVDTSLQTGRFAIGGLFVGPFTLRAAGPFSPDPIAVEATMPAPDQEVVVDLRLQPTSQLTGRVVMPDGETLAPANTPVHFKSDSVKTVCSENQYGETTCESFPQGVQSADAVTGTDGIFTFPVLNAGRYTLTVDGPGGRTAVVKGTLAAGVQGRVDVRLPGVSPIQVQVRAADTTTPIPGAKVEVSQVGAPNKKVSFDANDDGVITFEGADAFSEGDFVVVATDLRNGAKGRASGKVTADNQLVTVPVYLNTSSGVVFGRVTRPDGTAPVANAQVVITAGPSPVAFAITDEEGKYREVGIPLGAVRVEVFDAATARRGYAAGQIVTNGAQLELNVVQDGQGVVRGRVVESLALQPLRGWRVQISGTTPSGRSMPPLVTTTGIDGGFSFPGTPVGRFTVTATKPGEPGHGTAQGSIIREGELVEVPVIATIPRNPVGTIVGTVVDHVGAPVPDAHVEVRQSGSTGATSITADGSGRFTFGPTPLNRYHLRAQRQGSRESGATAVDIAFDGQTVPASVVLTGLGTVTGVVMQNGSPVPGAPVTLKGLPDAGCGPACSGFADGEGRFRFEQVSARSFTVTASNTAGTLHGSIGDVLDAGGTADVTVQLEPTRRLTGRAVDAEARPVTGAVAEVKIGSRRFFAESGATGAFEFAALPLGAYRLDLRDATGPGMAVRLGTIVNDVSLGDVTLDGAPPRVLSVTPLPSAVAVPRTQSVTLLFSEAIERASISAESVQLTSATGAVDLAIPTYHANDTQVVFQPSAQLTPETVYTLTVNGVRDRAGRAMTAPYTSTFTTVDVSAPTVADASPAAGTHGVSAFSTIRIRFSEPIAPAKFEGPAIQLLHNGAAVAGEVEPILGNTVVVFTPDVPLAEDATYTVRLAPATDLSGNKQAQGLDYTFTTTDRTPPQVISLVAAGDGTVIENGPTEVTAQVGTAQDVLFVDFYLNDQIAFTARTAPYKLALRAVPALGAPGASIKVSAHATDTSGNRSATPATVLVPIRPDQPPTVTLLSPAAGASVPNGSTLNIQVRGTDDLGLTQVGYRVTINQAVRTSARAIDPAARETTQAFEFQVPSGTAPGAVVRVEPTGLDAKGQAVVGAAVELRVLDAAPPVVNITGVTSGASVRPGQPTTVVVSAEDAGLVRSVTFAASGAASFTQTRTIDPAQAAVAASFTFTVPAMANATQTVTLKASATDSAGNSADAATVVLPVADLVPPTITLRTSNDRPEMVPGTPLVVIATANDEKGVGRIELTGAGAIPVAEGQTFDPPIATAEATFTISTTGIEPGAILQLQARAIDGANNISAPVSLTITAVGAVDVTLPASAIINAGSTQTVEVRLTADPPPSGVTVDLSTENPAIATVSTPVVFTGTERMKVATITALAGGSTPLVARVQGVERARMTVTVQGGIVTGVVLDPDQNPVEGALVTVSSGLTTATAESGDGGVYTVQGISGPSVTVRALHEESGLYGLSRGTMAENGYLELDVMLLDAGSITGVVRRANNEPVDAGVQVAIYAGTSTTPEQTVNTLDGGVYEFPLVSVGSYRLEAADANGNRGRSNVTVAGGDQLSRDITFLGRGTVSGVVRTSGNQPVAAALSFKSTSIFGSTTIARNTEDDGTFEFTGVFVGDFTVTAERAGTGEAGEASGAVANDGEIVDDVVVTLSPVGSLSGVVRRADESTVSGAAVAVGGRQTTTDQDGKYSFAFLPAGAFTVNATVDGTREKGTANGTIVAGKPTTQDVVLVPQGRLQVTVTNADDEPVEGASVMVSVSVGTLGDQLTGTTGSNGTVLIEHVMAGDYTVRAEKNNLSGTAAGALAPGTTAPVAIELQAEGTITGIVYLPGGEQTATSGMVTAGGLTSAAIGSDGRYTFTNVRAGTYQLSAFVGGLRRALVRSVVMPAGGGVVTRNLELIGVGTVKGRVLNGSAGVANMLVRVENYHPDFAHTRNVRTDEAGYYEAANMVFGPIEVSAGSDALRGEATGALTRSDLPLTLDILLTNNATTLPQTLIDANGSRFDMQMHGGLAAQSAGFHHGFQLDIVSNGSPIRFTGEGIPTNENGGREVATRQENVGGLNVTRKLFVPATGYFGRWLEILTNPTEQPITVDVRLTTGVGPTSGTHPATSIVRTSSGDALLDVTGATPDRWLVVDDATDVDPNVTPGGVPAIAFVFDGAGAALRAGEASYTVLASGSDRNTMQHTWQGVTIAPGQSVALMHFGVRQMTRAGAVASAERLVQLPPEALSGLNPNELPIVGNFAVPQDGNSALVPLAPINGKVTGKALAGDGSTPVAGVEVRFKSDSLFYGRTYKLADSLADGSFTLQHTHTANAQIAVSTGDGFTLTAEHPETKVAAPPVTGTFAAGESQAVANVVFTGTGLVKGQVKRHNGAFVTTGLVTLVANGQDVDRTIGATSSFSYHGVPTGTVTLKGWHRPAGVDPQGTGITGTATATIVAGEMTTQDVTLEPTGAITGLVKNGASGPASGVSVVLERAQFTRTVTTDTSGRYTFNDVPLGDFTVRAIEPETRVSTSAPAAVAQDQTTPMPDLVLIGYGTLQIQVTWANGEPVDRSIGLQVTEVARGNTRSFSTNTSGQATLDDVTTAGWTLKAFHPQDSTLFSQIEGALTHGQKLPVTIKLPARGSVTVKVRYPGGVEPGIVPVELRGGVTESTNSDVHGDATFTGVGGNPFTVRSATSTTNRNIFRETGPHQVTSDGQNLQINLQLPALATLAVTAKQGDNVAVGARVAIRHAFATSYGNPVTVNATTGTASFANTPEGLVLIRVTSSTGAILADAEATIVADDHGQTVPVTVQAGATLPRTLTDANAFQFDVAPNGRTASGSVVAGQGHKAYDSGLQLRLHVNGEMLPFTGSPVAQLEANGRELVIRDANGLAGLDVTRKVFVPATGYFARYVEILRNLNEDAITVDLEVVSDLDSEGATTVVDQTAGAWIVTDDDSGSTPYPASDQVLAHVFAGNGATTLAPPVTTLPTASADTLGYRWNSITLESGQSVAVMHFAVQQPSRTAAQASAMRLAQLPPEALADLSAAEIAAIGNFEVPADGVGTVPPIVVASGFTVSGSIFTWNGTTPANPRNTVTLRSGNPIYSREVTATANTSNAYTISGTIADSWTLEVINRPPSPFDGWSAPRQTTRALTPGETSATEHVVFSGTGTVNGSVTLSNGAPVTSGTLTFTLNGPNAVSISSFTNGTFALPIVPPGLYTMTTNVGGRVSTTPVAVAANAVTPVNLRVPARASVKIVVTNPNGSPAANPGVELTHAGGRLVNTANGSGTFTFTGIHEGPITVRATEHPNLGSRYGSVQSAVTADDEGKVIDVPVALKAQATLRVTVTRGGTPVPDVVVWLRHSESSSFSVYGETDGSGQRLLADTPAGPYEVQVRNGEGTVVMGTTNGSLPQTVDGQTVDVAVTLPVNPATVTGTVFAADGQTRVRDMELRVRLLDGEREVADLATSDGRYTFADVAPPAGGTGTLRLRVNYPTWDSETFVEQEVTVAEGQTVTRDVTLPLSAVTGIVRTHDGGIPDFADVLVEFADGSFFSSIDEEGRYAVFNVPVGEFTVNAWVGSRVATTVGSVTAPETVASADVVLGRVTGAVTYADGSPAPSPTVFATQTPRPGFEVTSNASSTNTQGGYLLYGPQPGPVTVTAQSLGLEAVGTTVMPSGSNVTAVLDLQLEADGIVSGTVRDAADAPVEGADIVLSIPGLERTVKTDVFGKFRFEHVKLGPFTVQARVGTGPSAQVTGTTGNLTAEVPTADLPLKFQPHP